MQLLAVATLNPNKGHEILLEALAAIPHKNWHLTCAGSVTRHPATVDRVRAAIRRLQLDDRVTLVGELDAVTLHECYDRADVFVLATRQETYGMAVAEALARGLPVVSTTTGAIPESGGRRCRSAGAAWKRRGTCRSTCQRHRRRPAARATRRWCEEGA